jgi:large subunit ribosomal protein L6
MSRIGKLALAVPPGVNVTLNDNIISVKGPKGELHQDILSQIVDVKLENGKVLVERKGEARVHRSVHGLTRTLIANMLEGVSRGYRRSLEIHGVGFRAAKSGEKLNLSLGYSHPVVFDAPKGIVLTIEGQTKIHVEGIDKQAVGQAAAEIRNLRPPEPYKGKGIRYAGEIVRKKLGKAGKAAKT